MVPIGGEGGVGGLGKRNGGGEAGFGSLMAGYSTRSPQSDDSSVPLDAPVSSHLSAHLGGECIASGQQSAVRQ